MGVPPTNHFGIVTGFIALNCMISIRAEKSEDADAIRLIHKKAFGGIQEADIIKKLRLNCHELLSMVTLHGDKLVGHILFSPATIEGYHGVLEGMGVAPMAVPPDCQRKEIGSKLVRSGMDILEKHSCPFIIVLGHPHYYPRFGFETASKYGIRCQWEGVPEEVFMILWLDKSKMKGVSGIAKYREEFNEAM
jgi:putative acetyltransferase